MTKEDETLYALATLIAAYTNPHVHFDLAQFQEEDKLELNCELEHLKNLMREMVGE
jgi:hypothetical protein